MIEARSARRRASFFALCATTLFVALALGACQPTQRSNGESCISDEDCLSGVCVQNQCTNVTPFLDAETDAPPSDATTPGDAPAAEGSASDSGAETGTKDSGQGTEASPPESGGGDSSSGDSAAD
jgi:hypothetical protein